MAARPDLSIVIPAFNEEGRIGPSLKAILAWAVLQPRAIEIVVVDDGSRDRTAEVARGAFASSLPNNVQTSVLVNPQNRGKGYSIRRGVLAATGRLALVSDADLSTPIEDAAKLLAALEPAGRGLAIGSRALRESNVEIHQNVLREVMGKVFNRIVRLMTRLPFHDTQCGFKLMARDDVAPIFAKARIDGFSYDVELIYVAVRRGLPVREVGVTWRNAPGSKVGMLSDPLRMLRDVWRVRSWYRQGLYDAP